MLSQRFTLTCPSNAVPTGQQGPREAQGAASNANSEAWSHMTVVFSSTLKTVTRLEPAARFILQCEKQVCKKCKSTIDATCIVISHSLILKCDKNNYDTYLQPSMYTSTTRLLDAMGPYPRHGAMSSVRADHPWPREMLSQFFSCVRRASRNRLPDPSQGSVDISCAWHAEACQEDSTSHHWEMQLPCVFGLAT